MKVTQNKLARFDVTERTISTNKERDTDELIK